MVSVMIDVDKTPEPARKLNVGPLPTILFLKPNGTVIHKIEGYLKPNEFVREMQAALDKSKKS